MQMLFSLLVTDMFGRTLNVQEIVTWLAAATVGNLIDRRARQRRG